MFELIFYRGVAWADFAKRTGERTLPKPSTTGVRYDRYPSHGQIRIDADRNVPEGASHAIEVVEVLHERKAKR